MFHRLQLDLAIPPWIGAMTTISTLAQIVFRCRIYPCILKREYCNLLAVLRYDSSMCCACRRMRLAYTDPSIKYHSRLIGETDKSSDYEKNALMVRGGVY